jgi:hypothetical protein
MCPFKGKLVWASRDDGLWEMTRKYPGTPQKTRAFLVRYNYASSSSQAYLSSVTRVVLVSLVQDKEGDCFPEGRTMSCLESNKRLLRSLFLHLLIQLKITRMSKWHISGWHICFLSLVGTGYLL